MELLYDTFTAYVTAVSTVQFSFVNIMY